MQKLKFALGELYVNVCPKCSNSDCYKGYGLYLALLQRCFPALEVNHFWFSGFSFVILMRIGFWIKNIYAKRNSYNQLKISCTKAHGTHVVFAVRCGDSYFSHPLTLKEARGSQLVITATRDAIL